MTPANLLNYLQDLSIDTSTIQDHSLLLQTFTHKSYAMDFVDLVQHNERLEFLGDSILGAHIAMKLYQDFPDYSEAQLTLYKIALVREETLARAAKEINLQDHILLSKGEEKMGGRDKHAILADCLEALIGYLSIVFGSDVARCFVETHIYSKVANIQDYIPVKSYKSRAQELVQKAYKVLPTYVDREEEVDATGNVTLFASELYIKDQLKASGTGASKKKAQEAAAKMFVERERG